MSASNPLAYILEINRLTGINFKDWLKNLRIVLISKKIRYILDQHTPALPAHPTADQRAALDKWTEDDFRIKCYVLASISNEL